jgi:hypothetical protein
MIPPSRPQGGSMEQKIVVHMRDGVIHKGVTQNFDPDEPMFHFLPAEGGGVPLRLRFAEMKAVFWVKDYLGNRHFVARRSFDPDEQARRAIASFHDGEEIWGTLGDSSKDGSGFFLFPSDPRDNNIRMFIVRAALKDLRLVT